MRMNSAARLSAACALVVVLAVGAHAQQKPCVTASKFGPDDQIGNLNYLTPAKTLAASKLVTRGKAYRLGIETNKDTPAYENRKIASLTPVSQNRPRFLKIASLTPVSVLLEFLVLLMTSPVKPMLIPGILMYNEIYLELRMRT